MNSSHSVTLNNQAETASRMGVMININGNLVSLAERTDRACRIEDDMSVGQRVVHIQFICRIIQTARFNKIASGGIEECQTCFEGNIGFPPKVNVGYRIIYINEGVEHGVLP